jgi:tetratricopeptide (TPR) repeat protein
MDRLEDAASFIQSIHHMFEDNASMWNLLGNVRFASGEWDDAARAYGKAVELNPELPLHRLNLAKALDAMGRKTEALDLYIEVGGQFFKEQAFEDVADLLPRIRRINARDFRLGALEAKLFFYEGRKQDARRIFQFLINNGYCDDSSVFFLLGLIVSESGDKNQAAALFRRAVELEPGVAAYRLRLAETLFMSGAEAEAEIAAAYRMNPDDAWVNNLYGQFHMQNKEPEKAASFFEKAFALAPGEPDIAVNYSECLARMADLPRAMGALDEAIEKAPDSAKLHNQSGNIFASEKKYAEARVAYERAVKKDPYNPVYLKNCASVCIELDMIMRAEELLKRSIDIEETPECFNLIGHLALITGELERAEAALREGLELDPSDDDLKVNLARLHFERKRTQEARKVLEEVLERDPENEKAAKLLERIHREVDVELRCASCGRRWWVPKHLPPQPALKVRGEPPSACPAGKCPRCAKVYCIACAQEHLEGSRLVCGDCREPLRISDDGLKYLVAGFVADEQDRLSGD